MASRKRQKTLLHFFASSGTQQARPDPQERGALCDRPGAQLSTLKQCSSQQLQLLSQSSIVQQQTAVSALDVPTCSAHHQPQVHALCQQSNGVQAPGSQSDKPPSGKTMIMPSSSEESSKDCSSSSPSSADDAGISSQPFSTDDAAEPQKPNAYEQQRQQRIKQNLERMQMLGIQNLSANPPILPKPALKKQMNTKQPQSAALQKMYSLRSRGQASSGTDLEAAEVQGSAAIDDAGPVDKIFDDSSVLQYVCQGHAWVEEPSSSTGTVSGFVEMPGWLADAKLARAYSMDVCGSLLAAGGKNGQAAVFGICNIMAGKRGASGPLLSAKLHSSWIADVQLVALRPASALVEADLSTAEHEGRGQSPHETPLLLTASNDGTVAVWDLSQCCEQGRHDVLPRQLAKTNGLHSGGIWSMHLMDGRIVTGSKDSGLTESVLSPDGAVTLVHRFQQQHEGAVKCVRWGRPGLAASCGNDMLIKVTDTRTACCSSLIADAHQGCVNYVRWHPSNAEVLLSCGTDAAVRLWDLRKTSSPVHSFTGHTQLPRCSQIYQPQFVAGGDGVATGGSKSTQLSLYCTKTGRPISRGEIGFEPAATATIGSKLLCSTTKQIYVYNAK